MLVLSLEIGYYVKEIIPYSQKFNINLHISESDGTEPCQDCAPALHYNGSHCFRHSCMYVIENLDVLPIKQTGEKDVQISTPLD